MFDTVNDHMLTERYPQLVKMYIKPRNDFILGYFLAKLDDLPEEIAKNQFIRLLKEAET